MFHAQRHVGRAAGRLATADHPLCVLDRDAALALLHEDHSDDDTERDDREKQLSVAEPLIHALMPAGAEVRIEAKISSENSVADAALRDQLSHPHQERAARG